MAQAAFAEISKSKYPTSLKLKACGCRPINPQNPAAQDQWQANIDETVRLAVEWIEETANQPKEQKFVWEEIGPYITTGLWSAEGHFDAQEKLFKAVEKADKVHPWMKKMVEGCYYDALGWKLRGSGYANTVTEEGWRGFKENIEKAANCLTKAWELDRTVPYAAAQMIYVVNSGAESQLSPRDWFDRAVQTRMDYDPAYRFLVHHLLPQWSGSHGEMYQFGLECMKTNRYDTAVPFQLLEILFQIDEQWGGKGEIWREEGVYENAKTILEKMEKEVPHTREFARKGVNSDWILTLQGAIAIKAEQYDDARKAFDKVGMKLQRDAFDFADATSPWTAREFTRLPAAAARTSAISRIASPWAN